MAGRPLARRALDATNALLAGAARLAWPRTERSPRRICVWRTGNVGDMVCALPALAAIRVTYPSAEITLCTSPGKPGAPGAQQLLEGAPWLHELWVYHPGEESIRGFAREFARRDFDLVLRLPQNMGTPRRELRDLLFLRFFARVRCARVFAVGSLSWLGNAAARALGRDPALEHESARLLDLLGDLVVPTTGAEFPLPLTGDVRDEAERLLLRHGVAGGEVLCLSPGAKRATNRWPVERFGEVARRWSDTGRPAVVIGSAGESPLAERIVELTGGRAVNLCGESPLLVAAEVLRQGALLVTNDTGPMHLAAAVGTPCVVPFSARDVPKRWYPHPLGRTDHVVLRADVPCSPCFVEECPIENRCLAEIDVERTWNAVEKVAEARRRERPVPAQAN